MVLIRPFTRSAQGKWGGRSRILLPTRVSAPSPLIAFLHNTGGMEPTRCSIPAYRVLVDELDFRTAGALRALQFLGHSGLEWLFLDAAIGPENCPYLRREIEDNRLDLRADFRSRTTAAKATAEAKFAASLPPVIDR
jgi:hypothetical protein